MLQSTPNPRPDHSIRTNLQKLIKSALNQSSCGMWIYEVKCKWMWLLTHDEQGIPSRVQLNFDFTNGELAIVSHAQHRFPQQWKWTWQASKMVAVLLRFQQTFVTLDLHWLCRYYNDTITYNYDSVYNYRWVDISNKEVAKFQRHNTILSWGDTFSRHSMTITNQQSTMMHKPTLHWKISLYLVSTIHLSVPFYVYTSVLT